MSVLCPKTNKKTNPKQVQNTKHETGITGTPFATHVTI